MASSAVALADDPTPTPTPAPTPEPVATVVAIETAAPTVIATATPVLTAVPTSTPSPSPSPTATPAAPASPKPPTATHYKPQPTHGPRQAATPTPAATEPPTGAELTLCHFIDPTGPYEAVTVPADEFSDHFDHPKDIIPAPASGCDGITDPEAAANQPLAICHATGDPTRPYELVGLPDASDLEGHEFHPGDLIPAPNNTCPGLTEYFVPTPTPEPTAEPTTEPTVEPTARPTVEPTATATATATATDGAGTDDNSTSGGTVLGARSTTTTSQATYLPFTGFELWLIAAAGLGLTLCGAGLRLLAGQPAVGVTL